WRILQVGREGCHGIRVADVGKPGAERYMRAVVARQTDAAKLRLARRNGADLLPAVVRAAVVYEEDANIAIGSRQQRPGHGGFVRLHPRAFVVYRRQHEDERAGRLRRHRSSHSANSGPTSAASSRIETA